MWDFLDLIFFAAIAGAFIWLYIHDRKLEKPQVNVTVNVPETKVVNNPGNHTISHTGTWNSDNVEKTTTNNVVPIEEPDRSDDWININPTDSN